MYCTPLLERSSQMCLIVLPSKVMIWIRKASRNLLTYTGKGKYCLFRDEIYLTWENRWRPIILPTRLYLSPLSRQCQPISQFPCSFLYGGGLGSIERRQKERKSGSPWFLSYTVLGALPGFDL